MVCTAEPHTAWNPLWRPIAHGIVIAGTVQSLAPIVLIAGNRAEILVPGW